MKSREEVYNKLIEMNEHRQKFIQILDNPSEEQLQNVDDIREEYNQQCSMIDLIEWVLDIEHINQNKDE